MGAELRALSSKPNRQLWCPLTLTPPCPHQDSNDKHDFFLARLADALTPEGIEALRPVRPGHGCVGWTSQQVGWVQAAGSWTALRCPLGAFHRHTLTVGGWCPNPAGLGG